MKRAMISSKSSFCLYMIAVSCFLLFYLGCMCLHKKNWYVSVFMMIMMLPFLIISLIVLNRLCCIVWHDEKYVGRKGLLFGFQYKIKISEIEKVIVASISKQGKYLIIVDPYGTSMEGLHKKSFIRLEYSEKNIRYIKTFWKKGIILQ